jgi:hypothetical protein
VGYLTAISAQQSIHHWMIWWLDKLNSTENWSWHNLNAIPAFTGYEWELIMAQFECYPSIFLENKWELIMAWLGCYPSTALEKFGHIKQPVWRQPVSQLRFKPGTSWIQV